MTKAVDVWGVWGGFGEGESCCLCVIYYMSVDKELLFGGVICDGAGVQSHVRERVTA